MINLGHNCGLKARQLKTILNDNVRRGLNQAIDFHNDISDNNSNKR
jgi:hypothetical protein